jgi:tRNA(Ile)-lysidine synthase
MKQLARERALTLAVVHFNHRLRGQESDEDERLVKSCARDTGLEFIGSAAEVLAVARAKRRNLEETARQVRYDFFVSLVNQGRLDRVATGHTANDQAETVLLRLIRGSGTRGLGGIYPKLETGIVRPFLSLTRNEVEEEIAARGLQYRADATNLDTRFARNKIRLELLPWLAKGLNPNVIKSLNHWGDRARADENYLEREAAEQLGRFRSRSKGEQRIQARVLSDLHPAIARRVLRQMIAEVRGNLRGISHTHVEDLRGLSAESQSGKQLSFGGLIAAKEFDCLLLTRAPARSEPTEFSYAIRPPCRVDVPALRVAFTLEIVTEWERKRRYNCSAENGLKNLTEIDPRKLSPDLILRSWRPGDRFHPWGTRNPTKLKDLLRERRIPARERKVWPVLESGTDIVWVRGLPPASFAAADVDTGDRLSITEEARDLA